MKSMSDIYPWNWSTFSPSLTDKLKDPFEKLAGGIFDGIKTAAEGIGNTLMQTGGILKNLADPLLDVLIDAGIGAFADLELLFAPKVQAEIDKVKRTIHMGIPSSKRDVITLGLGRIGIEIGATDIGFGQNNVQYALGFTKRPITIPLSLKLERFPLLIPTGEFTNYEFKKKFSFNKNIIITTLDFTTPEISFSIPFLEFKSLGIPIPFIGIPKGLGDKDGLTIFSFHRSYVPLRYISIGLISSWFRWPRKLGPGEHGSGRPPMYTIPDREEIDSMISEKLRLSNETLKASLSFHR